MPAATLARFVVLEALRSGLPWLTAAAILLVGGLAAFLAQLAVTESRALQIAIVAAVLRAGAVFLVAAHVASSTLREINDKGLELMLALPLRRSTHYLGRLAGFAACGAALAAAFALPLALWVPPGLVALWAVSLACEAALAAAAALFFSMTLAQLVPAMAATLGLYLLARSIATIQSIAAGPLAEPSLAAQLQRFVVDGIALLLPRLDGVTRSEWLLYGAPPPGAYLAGLAGLVLYAALLTAAGLFDFHRRSL
jgi:ABC-type transport system involved in multi-copper enzyme maturation permease subunit